MKIGKNILGVFLVLLVASVFVIAPVSAKKPSNDGVKGLQVSIDTIEVVDLEGDGENDDIILGGKIGILAGQSGTYQVSLTLDLKYLGTNQENPIEKKTKFDKTVRKTIYVYCEAGKWTYADYAFEILDKIGWYRGQVTAKSGGLIAESNSVEFDPPGGSVGPVCW